MKTKIVSLIYFLIGFLYVILLTHLSFPAGFILKGLIIPVLLVLFLITISKEKDRIKWLIFAGLIFSWAGDVILELSQRNDKLFIPGLLCFLLAQLMYFTVFVKTPGKNVIFGNRMYLLVPVLLYGVGLVLYLYDYLGVMRIPVILYAFVILSMLVGAINRLEKVNRISFYMVLAGAILFVISDSAIAINKFSCHFEASEIVIMSTYILAQFLIISGYIRESG